MDAGHDVGARKGEFRLERVRQPDPRLTLQLPTKETTA